MSIKVAVLLVQNQKVLLLKEWSNKRNGYYWNLIKGTFESKLDKSLKDCAIREAKEEVGMDISLEKIIDITIKHDIENKIYITYLGKATSNTSFGSIPSKLKQQARNEDIQETQWFSKDEFKRLNEDELMSSLIKKVYEKWQSNELYSLNLITELNI